MEVIIKETRYKNEVVGDLNESDGIECGYCLNKGFIFNVDTVKKENYAIPCPKCTNERRVVNLIKKSGLGRMIQNFTFDKYVATTEWQKSIKQKALEFANSGFKTKWWFIGGQVGSGKTFICSSITIELIRKGHEVHYMLWRDQIVKIKANVNTEEYAREIEMLKNVKILYIDDFFKADNEPTSSDKNIAFEIINHRYNNNLTTIISSEYEMKKITNLDSAISSRIIEMCTNEYIILLPKDDGKNYRTK